MTTSIVTLFGKNKDDYRINDIAGATVKIALVSSAWTPDVTVTGNALWADVSANEIAAVNGYSAGGVALASLAVAANAGNTGYKFSSGTAVWTAAGGNIAAWRYAVMYISGTLWGQTNPLIGYFLGDDTPADIPATSVGQTLTLTCPAAGWFDLT